MSFWVCRTIKLPLNSRCARKPSGTQLPIHLGVQCKQTTKLSAHTFHLFTLYMDLALHKCILKYRKSKHRRAQNRRRVQFRCEIAQPKWIAYMAFWTIENAKVAVFFVFYCYANHSNCKWVWIHEACRCHRWNAYWETHIIVFVFILLWMFLFRFSCRILFSFGWCVCTCEFGCRRSNLPTFLVQLDHVIDHVVMSVVGGGGFFSRIWCSFYSPIELWIFARFFFVLIPRIFAIRFYAHSFVVFHQFELTYSHPYSVSYNIFPLLPPLQAFNVRIENLYHFGSFLSAVRYHKQSHYVCMVIFAWWLKRDKTTHATYTNPNAATLSLGQYFLSCFLYIYSCIIQMLAEFWCETTCCGHADGSICRRENLILYTIKQKHNALCKFKIHAFVVSFSPPTCALTDVFSLFLSIVLGCFNFSTCRSHCCFLLQIKLPFLFILPWNILKMSLFVDLFSLRFVVTVWF